MRASENEECSQPYLPSFNGSAHNECKTNRAFDVPNTTLSRVEILPLMKKVLVVNLAENHRSPNFRKTLHPNINSDREAEVLRRYVCVV